MDVSPLLDALNDAQREAVAAPPGHTLVLAGAGSGKTRVLVHRIAWLVGVDRVPEHAILAVTFTNKAAAEMRHRVQSMVSDLGRGMWVGTFHGLAHRLLRRHFREAGLPETFQILDSDDQLRLIKRVQRDQGLDDARFPPRQSQWFINHCKDEGQRAEHLDAYGDGLKQVKIAVYAEYEARCQRSGLVDFAELLLRSQELLLRDPHLLEHYRQRFRHILVDEFQDTNEIQYAWIRLLAGDTGQVMVVGDDDQSIYGWRGAKVANVGRFQEDFPHVRLLRLEQNYRSTANILNAANALIAHNSERLGKHLWTDGAPGEPLTLFAAYNEMDEARFVVERVREWIAQGQAATDAAILYRSNAQSRIFEQQLIAAGVPYRIYGGQRFFERVEIKDTLAYLRMLTNPDDDAAFERAVNTPSRGIGAKTLAQVRARAATDQMSLWRAAGDLCDGGGLASRAAHALSDFLQLIAELGADLAGRELAEKIERVITRVELVAHYQSEGAERAQTRVENLEELVRAARGFVLQAEAAEDDPLVAFLANAALEAGESQAAEGEDCVQLMTLHAAKGLEFPLVFMCGLEDGLFPHMRAVEEAGRMEEERRLAYVGITRAKRLLYLCYAEQRRWHGGNTARRLSKFVSEIPAELIREIRPRIQVSRAWQSGGPGVSPVANQCAIKLGQNVRHDSFGHGVVVNVEGAGEHARALINFEQVGSKWMVLSYGNLEML